MAHDYAKRPKAPTPEPRKPLPGWAWFVVGLCTGLFIAFIAYLATSVQPDPEAEAIVDKPVPDAPKEPAETMSWDFYDIFPSAEVPVEEYDTAGTRVPAATESEWLLQAGSFRKAEDAEALRARLILEGLDVSTRTIEHDEQTWHRVLVGPLPTRLELDRTRRQLAEANIPSIPIQVKK